MRTRPVLFILVVLCAGCSAAAFFIGGIPLFAIASLVLGVLWILGLLRGWKWLPAICVIGINMLAVLALLFGLSSPLAIVSSFLALLGWDLSDFYFRLRLAARDDDTSVIERRHLVVLGLVALAGAAMLVFSLRVHIPVSFEWIVVLLLVGIWGITRIVRGLLKHDTSEE